MKTMKLEKRIAVRNLKIATKYLCFKLQIMKVKKEKSKFIHK